MVTNKKRRQLLLLFGFLIVISTITLSTFLFGKVSAANTVNSMKAPQKVTSWWYYKAMEQCFRTAAPHGNFASTDNILSGKLFATAGTAPAGYFLRVGNQLGIEGLSNIGSDGKINCDEGDNELSRSALAFWGISGQDILELYCKNGLRRNNNTDCVNGNGDVSFTNFDDKNSRANLFSSYINTKVYGGKTPYSVNISDQYRSVEALSSPEQYYFHLQSAQEACIRGEGSLTRLDTNPGGARIYELKELVTANGKVAAKSYFYVGTKDLTDSIAVYPSGYDISSGGLDHGNPTLTCKELRDRSNSLAQSAADNINNAAFEDFCKRNGYQQGELSACILGAQNKGKGETWCKSQTFSLILASFNVNKDKLVSACEKGLLGEIDVFTPGQDECTASTDNPSCATTSSCSIPGGLGWMICPVFNLLSGITEGIYGVISGLLATRVEIFDTKNGAYTAWVAMRNIANVGFVILFLIIILSQLTNQGVSNYGVKKLLPRLIIAALLVNLSYFVCQLAVDISNIIGSSLKTFLDSLSIFPAAQGILDKSTWITELTTTILTGQFALGTLAVGSIIAAYTGIGLLLPIILGALLALAAMVLILIARQALIILLVVIAPLAFLAMLLPNTENYFKQWRKIFIALLILYPAVALLFGGSRLAAAILLTSLGTDVFGKLAALAVMFVPLFVLPSMIKGSLNAVPAVGDLASKLQSRATGYMGNKAKQFKDATPIARGMAIRKQARENYRARKFAENVEKGGIGKLLAGGIRYDKVPGIGKFAGATAAASKSLARSALVTADEAESKDVDAEHLELMSRARKVADSEEGMMIPDGKGGQRQVTGEEASIAFLQQELGSSLAKGDTVRAKAAYRRLNETSESGADAAFSTLQANAASMSDDTHQSMQNFLKTINLKGRDNRANTYANGGKSGRAALASGYTAHLDPRNLDDTEIAGQTYGAMLQGIEQLSADDAQRILDKEKAGTLSLKGKKRAIMEMRAKNASQSDIKFAVESGGPDPTSVELDIPRE